MNRACVVGLFLGLSACASTSPQSKTVDVSGTVDGVSTANGRVVLVTPQGKAYVGSIATNGAFHVRIPSGTTFRLVVASAPATGSHPVAGHLVLAGGAQWASAGDGVTLGVLRPASKATTTTTAPGALAIKSEAEDPSAGADDGADDSGDDEDDAENAALCDAGGSDDAELHADAEPAASADDADNAERDHEDEAIGRACGQ